MIEDKYIGLALALGSSVAIGSSMVITKMGLNAAARKATYSSLPTDTHTQTSVSDNLTYLKNPIWWGGLGTLVIGEIMNFAAYMFAPPILVTPLGAGSVIVGAILASLFLHEELGHLGRLGCGICLIGSLIIVLHAPDDKAIDTMDQLWGYILQPGFMFYCFITTLFSLFMIFFIAPRYGRSDPIIYISIASVVGSISVMFVKGLGVAVKLTFSPNGINAFLEWSPYFFGVIVVGSILVQLNYLNKALDTFSTNVVNPIYYVGFSTSTIIASLILFQGFNTTDATNTASLICGFVVTFLGIHLLNLSRTPDVVHTDADGEGLLNPRLSVSLQGRVALVDSAGRAGANGWTRSSLDNSHAPTNPNGTFQFPPRNINALSSTATRQNTSQNNGTLFDVEEDEDDLHQSPSPNAVRMGRMGSIDERRAASDAQRRAAERGGGVGITSVGL